MIYDCFQFFNEIDILKLRLNVLNDIVDKFVISESTVTFSGNPKPLYFEENKELFKEFEDKIIHIIVDDTPMDCDAFKRDSHQKCAVMRGLKDAQNDDIVIFSDADEIPNPETLKSLLPTVEDGKIYALAQRNFYCYLNLEEVTGNLLSITSEFPGVTGSERKWLGTKICKKSLLDTYTTEQLRDKEQQGIMVRVPNGGWHFGYMGGKHVTNVSDRVSHKVISAAHQEVNNAKLLREAVDKINDGRDMFNRDAKFKIVPIDSSYPEYLRNNIEEYDYLVKNIDGPLTVFFRRIRIGYRNMMHKIKQFVWNCLHPGK